MVDILILGANGYSGRLTARYLLEHEQRGAFKLALAARTRAKVKSTGLALDESVSIWEVDVTDERSVDEVVQRAAVVIDCVGPFWHYGTNVAKSCARHGKHYVDITGEVPYIFQIINLCDYQATQTHSVIIPACGWDSAPSDIVVYMANKTLKSRYPNANIQDCVSAVDVKSPVAGGSFATLFTSLEEVPKNILQYCNEPYPLSPRAFPLPLEYLRSERSYPSFRLLYSLPAPMSFIKGGIFLMSAVNRAVVERTWGLHQFQFITSSPVPARDPALAYGPRFRYEEFEIRRSTFSALLLSISFALTSLSLMFLPPVRWLAKKILPGPGQGPSETEQKKGHLEMINITTAVDPAEMKPIRIRTTLRSDLQSLAALALLVPAKLPALARKGGVLTPMSGLGDALITRLQRTGLFAFSSEFVGDTEESAKRK
ncbi:Saccharopine dehydrogenase-domain-containing protein [Vararia minispora EC-137]|uniref:Saccharopine dehydrogenase-domain-containing protein n=1 Tax=Vararia minispora EC-137 TaxID=1314806 RepID=A0ACB8QKX4_9AGAM|nr:Saccharopine dehydrogenase-domain-containing protein [Vararia minispora EC-137]